MSRDMHMDSIQQPSRPPSELFKKTVVSAAYLYLRRVPILIGMTVVILPFAALLRTSPVIPLLQNLFMLSVEGTFWCTVAALVLTWSLLLTVRLVLLNGQERFGLPQRQYAAELSWRSVFGVVLVALPLVIGPFTQASDFRYSTTGWVHRILAVAAGLFFAYVLAFVALYAAVLLARAGTQDAAETFPAPRFMRRCLRRANERDVLPREFSRVCYWVRRHVPQELWTGYLDPANGVPWGGHWLALMFFSVTTCLYFGIDVYRRAYLGEATPIPALAFILLLLLNANWILSFLAFLLDRYRIPLIIPILILCIAGSHAPSSDHYYAIQRGVAVKGIYPTEVLRKRVDMKKPIVVIATAGGGIQAAVWTTQVLAGLEEQSKSWRTHSFADSVALVSSVSGGATGSMFYLNLYHPERQESFDYAGLNKISEVASDSSLDDIAWALVYRDIPRLFFPYANPSSEDKLVDRGFMLEEFWRNRGNVQADLSNWRLGVAEGMRPATIFNSTIAETGEPLIFATTDVKSDSEEVHRRSFHELYPDTDLSVVSAVRLAATFPYVSPASRAMSTKPEYHLVDGGYYDNYGVSSLILWLDEAFTGLQKEEKPLPDVLIVQIRSFPDDALLPPANKGWFFQSYAPIDVLLSVRNTAQMVRDRDALALFAQRWAKSPMQGTPSDRVHFATFQFTGHDAPLSWSMNQRQKDEISSLWNDVISATPTNTDLLAVHCFFDPAYADCLHLPRKGPW
jgi:predicted acylesterase/phospholipase RssA